MSARPDSRFVAFPCAGDTLYGSLHLPADRAASLGVVLLNQGPLDRSGAHRISMKLAQHWRDLGLAVLRFDARGVGESEGDWAEPQQGEPIARLYKQVEEGAWVPDTHAAIDCLQRETGVRRVILAGLCGGGATALHAGANHPLVHAVVMVGMPVRLQAEISGAGDLVHSKLEEETRGYLRKLFNPAAWRRFITLESDIATLVDVLWTRVRRAFRPGEAAAVGLNRPLIQAFREATRRGKHLLFVYPENDYLWTEFQELFLTHYRSGTHAFEVATIPDANHTFTEASWQAALYQVLRAWSQRQIAEVA